MSRLAFVVLVGQATDVVGRSEEAQTDKVGKGER